MTVDTIVANIKLRLIEDSTDQDAEIIESINDAYSSIAERRRWSWLEKQGSFTTSPNEMTYTLEGDGSNDVRHGSVYSVRIPDTPDYLPMKTYQEISMTYPDMDDTGTPFVWFQMGIDELETHYNPQIGLYWIPDSAMVVTYTYSRELTILASGDTPILPEHLHRPLQWLALSFMLNFDLEPSRSALWERRAEVGIVEAIKQDNIGRDTRFVLGGMTRKRSESDRRLIVGKNYI